MNTSINPIQKTLIGLIMIYQRTLSPDHGWFRARYPYGFCRYYPSCSEYAKEAIRLRGSIIGLLLAVRRVFRCNPWVRPAIDLIEH